MAQRFTARVRRGLKDIAAVYLEEVKRGRGQVTDKDVLAALAWIEENCADNETNGGGMPLEVPEWARKQFGGA